MIPAMITLRTAGSAFLRFRSNCRAVQRPPARRDHPSVRDNRARLGRAGKSDMELSTTPRNAVDLTSEAWVEDFDPIVADQSTLDGKLYGAEVWDVVAVGLARRELARLAAILPGGDR